MAVTLSFNIKQNSQSVANNTSNVTVDVIASWTYGSWNATGQCNGTLTIDGTKHSFSGIKFNVNHTTTGSEVVMTKTVNVTHNDDGTKTLYCSSVFNIYLGTATSVSGSASKVLTTITRASQPSCITWPEHTQNVGEFGDTISIHMNRESDAFTHTVRYTFGISGTIATGVTNGTTWTIPLSLMNQIPNGTSGSGMIYVDTYNGSTLIGTKSCRFVVSVPASVKPTCSMTLEDITGVDDIYGSPVKGLSRIKVTVAATKAYGSDIKSYSIKVNGETHSASTATSGVLLSSGSVPVTVTVKDARGRSGSASYNMSVQNYNAPAITKLTATRCNQDGTANKRGGYVKVTFSATVSSMSGKNIASYKLKYKKTSDSSYTTVNLSALANNFAPSDQTYIFEAVSGKSYNVVIEAIDRHNASKPSARSVLASTASAIFSWRGFSTSSGKQEGAGIGKVPEKPNTLEVGWNAEFDKNIVCKGNRYAFQADSFGGANGYTLLAVITVTGVNANAPIVFEIIKRGAISPMTVYVRFADSRDSTDPGLSTITYEGSNYGAFLVKASASTWKLYVDNSTGWTKPCLQSWYTSHLNTGCFNITFQDEQVNGTDPSVLGSYYRATPATQQSILDYIYPVGSIYLSYSHVSPASMFGGTWTRIENRFLWASSSTATIGGTGGEQTHTLTVNEMPSHNHKFLFNNSKYDGYGYGDTPTTTGSLNYLLSSKPKDVITKIADAGGGAAHNNMPPYIQVSAWRRTA